jgi:hypothetical protein
VNHATAHSGNDIASDSKWRFASAARRELGKADLEIAFRDAPQLGRDPIDAAADEPMESQRRAQR